MLFNGGIGKEAQMSKRDFLLVASTAAISSLLAYLAGANMVSSPEELHCESSAEFAEPPTASKAGNHGLGAAGALPQDSSPPGNENRSDDSPAPDPALAIQKQKKLGEQFSSFIKNNQDSGAINAKIESRFYSEEWNQEWAGTRESQIRTLFEANEDLIGITPLQVTCRSKNCQVVLSASGQDQVRLVSEKFMQAATRGDVGMKDKVVAFFPDISTRRVVFYLSEDGNMDLFQ